MSNWKWKYGIGVKVLNFTKMLYPVPITLIAYVCGTDRDACSSGQLHICPIVMPQLPDSKVYGANIGPIRGRQDPGGPYVGPMNLAIWEMLLQHFDAIHTHIHTHTNQRVTQGCLWHHTNITWIYRGELTPLGAVSIRKTVLPGMAIPMLKIRRPNGRLIFNMEITIRR